MTLVNLSEERERMELEARANGCKCPVCGQFVKVYKRSITSRMAAELITLYQLVKQNPDQRWFHITKINLYTGGGDFAKFEYWGLVVQQSHTPGEGGRRNSGFWRMTKKGEKFVRGEISVQKYCLVYNAKSLGMEGDEIFIKDALKNKFDYNELMKGTWDYV